MARRIAEPGLWVLHTRALLGPVQSPGMSTPALAREQPAAVTARCQDQDVTFTTRMLTEATWPDFATLVEANNGVWGGCWCMGFHPEGVGGKGQTAEVNRDIKRRYVEEGTVRQVLVYDGDDYVGWCQFGHPRELPNIKNPRTYEQGLDHLPDWRIGCVFTGSKHRGRGVAAAAVGRVLEEIGRAGGGSVEAYPEQTQDRKPQRGAYLHTGPEELYERFGFARVRQIAKWRWVMRAEVARC